MPELTIGTVAEPTFRDLAGSARVVAILKQDPPMNPFDGVSLSRPSYDAVVEVPSGGGSFKVRTKVWWTGSRWSYHSNVWYDPETGARIR